MLSATVICAALVLGGAKSPPPIDAELMADIRAVKTFPHEEKGQDPDPAMARIYARGCAVHPALFQLIETNQRLPGVEFPLFGEMNTGNIAVLALLHWAGWEEAIVEAVGIDKWNDDGMFAYYRLADTAKGRKRVRKMMEKHIVCRLAREPAPTVESSPAVP